MSDNLYDLIIIGGGPAGLTAGIYASRRNLKNLIITKDIGGQASTTSYVENYPGYEKVGGFELMQKFQNQAESFGSQFKYEEIVAVAKTNNHFSIKTTAGNQYQALSLILAFGKTPSNLNVPGEKEFTGHGVSYCATCDGPLFKNKTVAIIGGGNAALESADYLAQICQKVYLIHRRNEFRGEEVLVQRIKALKNVEILLEKVIAKISGEKFVKTIEIEDVNTKDKQELAVDGIFIEIGHTVNAQAIKELVKLNENKEIIVDADCQTSKPGIFAAGDVTNLKYKQIVISAGEGAKAALSAYKYISHLKGLKEPVFDWGKK
ncbi:MAG: thioredoxin-disulfide reductase [Candidatus Buchananbacteria bacterium RBG_13_39_9]|uniref:Thioredoxin reductase n=1 Tax=Candidatus Buchananbacteria bacterium RBG_13_39_9 TaxID=1797531 RepID=A0A1G1XQU9_9BACT|nr:MAG: thioredoxin-disulfide reductase [Candidatus Buchananbacteria bacterium RBG_13_39_9]